MATRDQARRSRALLSVYHYGRKQPGKRLHGRPTPLTLMPLHHAVSVLVKEPLDDHGTESLHAIRLALADLCRTRGGGRNSKVDRQIERLATAFSRVTHRENPDYDHAETARRFAEIFTNADDAQKTQSESENDAYQAALHRMVASGEEDRALPPPVQIWSITPGEGLDSAPASYRGTATVRGNFADLVARLDPQRWHDAFPYIWTDSFRTDPDYFVKPPRQEGAPPVAPGPSSPGAQTSVRPGGVRPLLRARASRPNDLSQPKTSDPRAPTENDSADRKTLVAPRPSNNPPPLPRGSSTLYEEALFGGYSYRNVLNVSFTPPASDQNPRTATYKYSQRACLETSRDPLDIQGGIDVDSGEASVVEINDETVKVDVNKQVRFTKPALFVEEMNDLAHVYVPLSLDSWIHGLIFSSVEAEAEAKEEKSDGKRQEERSAGRDRGREEDTRRAPRTLG
jgi:hypothetical protein